MRTLADAVSPLLAPYDPIQQNMSNKLQPPSGEHWFGTDNFGRDIFSRVLHGTGLTLFVGFFSVAIGATVGSLEAGKRADMLVVNGNPLERLGDLRQLAQIIQNGKDMLPDLGERFD